jgi:hypothetical protein
VTLVDDLGRRSHEEWFDDPLFVLFSEPAPDEPDHRSPVADRTATATAVMAMATRTQAAGSAQRG